jgi:leucyl/phenylalanyl-tRNA--protein transferase
MVFPPVEWADDDGLLAFGGDLDPLTLECAYRQGIFPWPVEGLPLLWFAPPKRAVLFFDEFRVSTRLRRELRQKDFQIKIDSAFEQVMEGCAAPRKDEEGTWILPEMQQAYARLHRKGIAHSVETWKDGELVGGLYGVSWGSYFCGESMFHVQSGASKAALVYLVEYLRGRGATWIDIQMMTPHFASFGAREIPRDNFQGLLNAAFNQSTCLFESPGNASP